ncbi:MAG: hypothetical protein ISR64_00240 [Deltaproteobacteria bacterium]|nr:hypothetical protein [Deltaproteobacteria bacterium]
MAGSTGGKIVAQILKEEGLDTNCFMFEAGKEECPLTANCDFILEPGATASQGSVATGSRRRKRTSTP